jgi:hypothetical protein
MEAGDISKKCPLQHSELPKSSAIQGAKVTLFATTSLLDVGAIHQLPSSFRGLYFDEFLAKLSNTISNHPVFIDAARCSWVFIHLGLGVLFHTFPRRDSP